MVRAASSSEPPNERGFGVPPSRSLSTASHEASPFTDTTDSVCLRQLGRSGFPGSRLVQSQLRADTSDSWWAGSWLRAGGHQISGSVDTISGHDTLVVNDGRGSFGWVGLVCHANQLIRKEPRGEVCQGSDGDLGGLRTDPVRAF